MDELRLHGVTELKIGGIESLNDIYNKQKITLVAKGKKFAIILFSEKVIE